MLFSKGVMSYKSFLTQYQKGELTPKEWRRTLLFFDRASNARIIILDAGGKVVNDSRLHLPLVSLLVITPVHLGEGRPGMVVFQTQAADIITPLAKARGLIMIAFARALLLAVPLLYFISRRVSAPLRVMHDSALALANGDFSRRVPVVTQDEVGELGKAFNYMASQLERFEISRREFLTTVSHDLRTPLTSIRGFVQGMLDKTIPIGEREYYLSLVFGEVQRLSKMVEELLDLGSIQAGQVEYNFERIELLEAVQEAVTKLTPFSQ